MRSSLFVGLGAVAGAVLVILLAVTILPGFRAAAPIHLALAQPDDAPLRIELSHPSRRYYAAWIEPAASSTVANAAAETAVTAADFGGARGGGPVVSSLNTVTVALPAWAGPDTCPITDAATSTLAGPGASASGGTAGCRLLAFAIEEPTPAFESWDLTPQWSLEGRNLYRDVHGHFTHQPNKPAVTIDGVRFQVWLSARWHLEGGATCRSDHLTGALRDAECDASDTPIGVYRFTLTMPAGAVRPSGGGGVQHGQ